MVVRIAQGGFDMLIRTLRTKKGIVIGGIILFFTTTLVAGIDSLAVQAMAQGMTKASERQGHHLDGAAWLQLIGFAFMATATLLKIWSGYCEALVSFQEDQMAGRAKGDLGSLRQKASRLVSLVAQREQAAASLEASNAKLASLQSQVESLKFVPLYSAELTDDLNRARESHTGESLRFWTLMNDATNGRHNPQGSQKKPSKLKAFWNRFFGKKEAH
jgi:hypothetical protein